MAKSGSEKQPGGMKGFFLRAGKSFYSGGIFAKDTSMWAAKILGKVGFIVAATSMVVFMPLLFEIGREAQMIEGERAQVKDLQSKGYSQRQLQELGFTDVAVHGPTVALGK
mmetsp:Transcript_14711/g.24925  ORF Transcript_14711/g.24925 Transcript_14711/m.24925 type:complete len:111 (-) Transcript_14711:149-481(-)